MSELFRENLERFNRKERFYVVKQATRGGFDLDDDFKKLIETKLGLKIPSDTAFVAMDYHFDWIYASLFLCNQPDGFADKTFKRKVFDTKLQKDLKLISATQEDVDLLIAAPDPTDSSITNLIMIEAKGCTPWTNSQAASKAKRLELIFKNAPYRHLLRPYYMIWSPRPSKDLKFECFPDWAKVNGEIPWVQMALNENLLKVTCCNNDEKRKNNLDGDYWKVEQV